MRSNIKWLAGLLGAAMTLAPAVVSGQETPPADPVWPLPLFHSRPEKGGFYLFGEFILMRQTNPLGRQKVAGRGFYTIEDPGSSTVGGFIGSNATALDVGDIASDEDFSPGFKIGLGWKFQNGVALEMSYLNLQKTQYTATASGPSPPNFQIGPLQADSFLTAPVWNFPQEYAGPLFDTPVLGGITTTPSSAAIGYGLWNAADIMNITFEQRYSQFDFGARFPLYENESWRLYALFGARFAWFWERFKWRTLDLGYTIADVADLNPRVLVNPLTGRVVAPILPVIRSVDLVPDNNNPYNVGIYTNIVSNRMYGPTFGFGNEFYLSHGLSISIDARVGLLLDIIKERAKYELGEKYAPPQIKRSVTEYAFVPELEANLNLWWYPIEGVQMRFGYNVMSFFNTAGARQPIGFDWRAINPQWENVTRVVDGLNFGIGFIF